jgi:transcription elongation factor Elf1
MFDLGKEKITIECPSCNRKHQATLQQVSNRATIHCSCGTNIKLEDKGGSTRRGIQSINDSMKKVNDAFKKLGK